MFRSQSLKKSSFATQQPLSSKPIHPNKPTTSQLPPNLTSSILSTPQTLFLKIHPRFSSSPHFPKTTTSLPLNSSITPSKPKNPTLLSHSQSNFKQEIVLINNRINHLQKSLEKVISNNNTSSSYKHIDNNRYCSKKLLSEYDDRNRNRDRKNSLEKSKKIKRYYYCNNQNENYNNRQIIQQRQRQRQLRQKQNQKQKMQRIIFQLYEQNLFYKKLFSKRLE